MRILTAVRAMQRQALAWRRRGVRVGFVPTMGYLHEGHLSLVRRARRLVGAQGQVVVSIYVNPAQFGPREDFSSYPRDLARDKRLCRDAGVDVLFVPSDRQMYPGEGANAFSTYVVEEQFSKGMESHARPTHFRGVVTVIVKLLNLVLPDVAVFGAKDFQQAAILKRMVRDLNFPTQIVVAPTRREPDGLALSSRNEYLSPDERQQAVTLWQAIQLAKQTVRAAGSPVLANRLKAKLRRFIETQPAARVDYIELFDPKTLQPVAQVKRGTHLALAVFIGKTRLIDNARL